jgi:hypothetical protein
MDVIYDLDPRWLEDSPRGHDRRDHGVLKICGGLGVDACELGTPIRSEDLAIQATD